MRVGVEISSPTCLIGFRYSISVKSWYYPDAVYLHWWGDAAWWVGV